MGVTFGLLCKAAALAEVHFSSRPCASEQKPNLRGVAHLFPGALLRGPRSPRNARGVQSRLPQAPHASAGPASVPCALVLSPRRPHLCLGVLRAKPLQGRWVPPPHLAERPEGLWDAC